MGLQIRLIVTLGVFIYGILYDNVFAAPPPFPLPPEIITQGGRFYDNWWRELGVKPPKQTHPSYPAKGKQKGAQTWRCKECHGWDYKGRNGAYGSGSHYTGIIGLEHAFAKKSSEIIAILKNKTHRYDKKLSDTALHQLAAFVNQGLVDMDSFINRKTKQVMGDANEGQQLYEQFCLSCHGSRGKKVKIGKRKTKVVNLNTMAIKNPWKVFHVIRNGHAGINPRKGQKTTASAMPTMLLHVAPPVQASLLKYLQGPMPAPKKVSKEKVKPSKSQSTKQLPHK